MGAEALCHNGAVKVQVLPFIFVFDPGNGTAGGIVVVVEGHAPVKAVGAAGAVKAVFDAGIPYLLAAFFAQRAIHRQKGFLAGRADQAAFWKDDAAADGTAAGEQDVEKQGQNGAGT